MLGGSLCARQAFMLNRLLATCAGELAGTVGCAQDGSDHILVFDSVRSPAGGSCAATASALRDLVNLYVTPNERNMHSNADAGGTDGPVDGNDDDAAGTSNGKDGTASFPSFSCFGPYLLVDGGECNRAVDALHNVMGAYASGDFAACILTTATATLTTTATTTQTAAYCTDKLDEQECADVTREECGNPLYGVYVLANCPVLCGLCRTTTAAATTRGECDGRADPQFCNARTQDECAHAIFGPALREACLVLCSTCPTPSTTGTTSATTTATSSQTSTGTTSKTTSPTTTSTGTSTMSTTATTTPSTTPTRSGTTSATTSQTTTATTTVTTSPTTSTTATTTAGCARGTYLRQDGNCITCHAGTFNDAIAHDANKCNDCTASCGPVEYKVRSCTARGDIKCSPCAICGKNEFTAAGCTETTNTVCLPVTNCQERCTFNDEAGRCWPSSHKIPCTTYNSDSESCAAASHCTFDGKKCITMNNGGGSEGARACITGGRADCQNIQSPDGNRCTWDQSIAVCRPQKCSDVYDPTECAANTLGCIFDTKLFYCNLQDTPVPCSRYYTSSMCAEASDHCGYSVEDQACITAIPSANFIARAPCSSFIGAALDSCPVDRCKHDTFANVCHGFYETVPCYRYQQKQVCPGDTSAIVREFQNVPPTRRSDAQCALQRPQCDRDTEYEIKAGTLTSDIQCVKLTTCTSSQYQSKAATTWSDRTCSPLTECIKGVCTILGKCQPNMEYEAVAPKEAAREGGGYISDRTCATVRGPCKEGTEFESGAPTPSSDRECSASSPSCTVPYQFEAIELTPTADRVCRFITPCAYLTEYESAASTATSDVQCKTATQPCDAGQEGEEDGGGTTTSTGDRKFFFEATALTATSDRVCTAVQECDPSTQFESAAPSATTDRSCSLVRTPCADDGTEFEYAAHTENTDRICAKVTACNSTAYELEAPSPTSDRVCGTIICPSQMFRPQHDANMTSDENKVLACQHIRGGCAVGEEYESEAATGTSDRVCAEITVCSLDLQFYARVPSTATADAQCALLQECTHSEQYENVAPTATSDRGCAECTTCSVGYRAASACNSTADTQCVPCNSCPPRNYLISNCTDDRPEPICDLCDECNIGFHWHPGLQGECTCIRCSSCAPDEFETKACTDTHDRSCQLIRDECSTDEMYESAEPSTTSDRMCAVATVCNTTLGEYEKSEYTLRSDRKCAMSTDCSTVLCNPFNSSDVKYQVSSAAYDTDTVCMCPKVCPPGNYEVSPPTPTADRECAPCPRGSFKNHTGSSAACVLWTECSETQWECSPPGKTADRKCCSISACEPDQYELDRPTRKLDRRCADQTVCKDGQWEHKEPTESSDRGCSSMEVCVPDVQFEVSPPSAKEDRVCAAIQSCFRGGAANSDWECGNYSNVTDRKCCSVQQCDMDTQFEESAPTPTSDRLCTNFTACSRLHYISKRGTANADRVCSPVSNCADRKPVSFQAKPATPHSDAVCIQATVCNAGMYEAHAAKAGADTVCRNCNGITQYQDAKGQPFCKPTRVCKQGVEYLSSPPTRSRNGVCKRYSKCGKDEYESSAPTASSDRECVQCSQCDFLREFKYRGCRNVSDDQNTVCRTVAKACDSQNQFEAVAPSVTSDRVCQNHRVCSANEWLAKEGDATHDSDCRRTTTCVAGEKQVARPQRTSNRLCSECTPGVDYTTGVNERFCTPCSLQCPPGFERKEECQATADIVCKVCSSGYFSSSEVCTVWTECQSGYFEVAAPSEVSDRICTPCPDGTWRAAASEGEVTSMLGCQRWVTCPEGTVSAETESRTADRTCVSITTSSPKRTTRARTTLAAEQPTTSTTALDLGASNAMASAGNEEVLVYGVMGGIGFLFLVILVMTISGKGCGHHKRQSSQTDINKKSAHHHEEARRNLDSNLEPEEFEEFDQVAPVVSVPYGDGGGGAGASHAGHAGPLTKGVQEQKKVKGKQKKLFANGPIPLPASAWENGVAKGVNLWALEHGVETSQL